MSITDLYGHPNDVLSFQELGRTGRDVFVVGAGLSIAATASFPTTDELGTQAVSALLAGSAYSGPKLERTFGRGQFERWLATLAEDQPYLSTSENLRNRALFSDLTEVMRSVLLSSENDANIAELDWFFQLVSTWHVRRSTVITFNYDTLVERLVSNHLLADPIDRTPIIARHVLDDLPPSPLEEDPLLGTGAATFRLLKLHGSVSWYWSPNDVTGSSVRRWDPPYGSTPTDPEVQEERRRLLPGLDPFIVPPTSAKGRYYQNSLTHELWVRAHDALASARRVFFLGYSFPVTDASVSGLIDVALRREGVECHVVDKFPDPIVDHLTSLGVADVQQLHAGDRCIPDFTEQYVSQASSRLCEALRRWEPSNRTGWLSMRWGAEGGYRYVGIDIVSVEPAEDGRSLVVRARSSPSGRSETPYLLDRLLSSLDGVTRIICAVDDYAFTVVDCSARAQRRGADYSVDSWNLEMWPAGLAPEELVARGSVRFALPREPRS